jgi:hypothetical protein
VTAPSLHPSRLHRGHRLRERRADHRGRRREDQWCAHLKLRLNLLLVVGYRRAARSPQQLMQGDHRAPCEQLSLCCADPTGRFGKKQTAGFDDRFCVDPDNPTIRAATGFPMCIPRSNPADGDDPLCPVRPRCQGSCSHPEAGIISSVFHEPAERCGLGAVLLNQRRAASHRHLSENLALQRQRVLCGRLIALRAVVHQVSTQRSVSAGIPDVSIQMNDPGNNPDPLKMVSPRRGMRVLLCP